MLAGCWGGGGGGGGGGGWSGVMGDTWLYTGQHKGLGRLVIAESSFPTLWQRFVAGLAWSEVVSENNASSSCSYYLPLLLPGMPQLQCIHWQACCSRILASNKWPPYAQSNPSQLAHQWIISPCTCSKAVVHSFKLHTTLTDELSCRRSLSRSWTLCRSGLSAQAEQEPDSDGCCGVCAAQPAPSCAHCQPAGSWLPSPR